jgi:hypothetical protein
MMFAAVEAMANTNSVGVTQGHKADFAAQATAGEAIHAQSPQEFYCFRLNLWILAAASMVIYHLCTNKSLHPK